MGIGRIVIDLAGEFMLKQIKKFSKLFSGKHSDSDLERDQPSAANPIYGRGTTRWRDYHPAPPVVPRKNMFRGRD